MTEWKISSLNTPTILALAMICFGPIAYHLGKIRGLDEANCLVLLVISVGVGILGLFVGFLGYRISKADKELLNNEATD